MDKNERINLLLDFIRYDYPRAASILKYSIGKPHADSVFEELLMYSAESNRQGFTTETFSAISELQDIHKELMLG